VAEALKPGIGERIDSVLSQVATSRRVRGGAVLVVGLLLWTTVSRYRHVNQLKAELAENQNMLRRLSAIVAQVEELERAAYMSRAYMSVTQDLLQQRRFLTRLLESMPAGLEVSRFEGSLGGRLSLTVFAQTEAEISGWLSSQSAGVKDAREGFVIVSTSSASSGPPAAVQVTVRPK